jgi:membrane-associated phospholipid phosphatase
MTSAIGAWIANLIVVNSAAVASILILKACAAVFGIGWGYRDHMTRWLSTLVRAAGLLMGLGVVARQVSQRGWLVDVDGTITTWLVGHRTTILNQIAPLVTNAFGPAVTACAAVLVAAVTVFRFHSYLGALIVIVTIGGASVCCTAMKLLLKRSRPPIGIQETLETDYSMPSGHVTGTVALFGMLVVVVGLGRSKAINRWLASVAVIVVAAVALSRLYLGVHWLTDVLAGMLLGSAAVVTGATTLRGLIDHHDAATSDQTVRAPHHEILL